MTVKELIQHLEKLPPDALVMVWDFGEGDTIEATEIEDISADGQSRMFAIVGSRGGDNA